MTLLILEGPDGGGKTTLGTQIAYSQPAMAITRDHGAYLGEKDIFHHYVDSLLSAARQPEKLFLLDRSWLSEPIYGEAMRQGQDRLGVAKRRMLDRVALSFGAVVILCLPPLDLVKATWENRKGAEYIQRERALVRVWTSYRNTLRNLTALPVINYDYTVTTMHSIKYAAYNSGYQNYGSGIGAWRFNTTLLVGEQPNLKDADGIPADWPFVSDRGCSPWFTEQLEKLHVNERDLYWLNAMDRRGKVLHRDQVAKLNPKRVIALGKLADKVLTMQDVDHVAIEHPQYWKRFHHKRRWTALRNALKEG